MWLCERLTTHGGWRRPRLRVPVPLRPHLTAEAQPRYAIRNGGLHGSSVDSRTSFGAPANGSYTWWGNAGSAARVTDSAPIGRCGPQPPTSALADEPYRPMSLAALGLLCSARSASRACTKPTDRLSAPCRR
jgi:hypothetical protein